MQSFQHQRPYRVIRKIFGVDTVAEMNRPLPIGARILLWGFVIMMFFSCETEAAAEKPLPFSIGETLSYSVRWEMVRAGKARFRVLPKTEYNGSEVWHFVLEVRSNRYVDMLYKIRDRLDGYTDPGFSNSVFYTKTQSGKDKKQIEVAFDWDKKIATYSNFGGKRPAIEIPSNTFDPLSAFYKMRTTELSPGKTLSFPITDGKKQFMQTAEVIEKQTLNIDGKDVETFLIIPSVNHFSGVFKKSENPTVRVWVSADDKKVPVLIKIKVFIGSVIFSLENSG